MTPDSAGVAEQVAAATFSLSAVSDATFRRQHPVPASGSADFILDAAFLVGAIPAGGREKNESKP